MKKVLFILAFLAIGMIATAQTQTIYNQLKLATVNDGTASDSLVLVQGTDKIIRKIPLSSISGSTEIPSLQEVTNNGNVTSHPIYAKEFRVDISPDSLMVLNNRYFSIGDLGNDYNGNWYKYFSLFDPNNYPNGLEIFNRDLATDGSVGLTLDTTEGNSIFSVNVNGDLGNAGFRLGSAGVSIGSSNSIQVMAGNPPIGLTIQPALEYTELLGRTTDGTVGNNFRVYPDYLYIGREASADVKSMKIYLNEFQPDGSNYSVTMPPGGGELAVRNLTIPITGTDMGIPISGSLEMTSYSTLPSVYTTDGTNFSGMYLDATEVTLGVDNSASTGYVSYIGIFDNKVFVNITDPASRGITAEQDYTANITALDFVQKKYVDDATVNSTTYYNVGGNITLTNDTTGDLTIASTGIKLAELGYGGLTLYRGSGGVNANITNNLLSASRTYELPNASGTLGTINTTAPASATAKGAVGEIRVTASYIYVCTATNTWVRAPLATW